MSRGPRVLIADKQPTVRTSVRRLLEGEGFEVCGEFADAGDAVEAALRERPDLCLIDVLIPGDGIRATRRIATELPKTPVVILTASEKRDHLIDAITAGAAGYLLKHMNPERLPSMLRGALRGEAAIAPVLVTRLVREFQSQWRRRVIAVGRRHVDLTARESEVMELMCEGLRNGEIAERLFISPVTVRRHISRVLSKLAVKDREQAVAVLREQI